jgi:hypothetical protein
MGLLHCKVYLFSKQSLRGPDCSGNQSECSILIWLKWFAFWFRQIFDYYWNESSNFFRIKKRILYLDITIELIKSDRKSITWRRSGRTHVHCLAFMYAYSSNWRCMRWRVMTMVLSQWNMISLFTCQIW